MGRKSSTAVLKLWFVPSISNTAAPTTTEINAGTNLTAFLRKNGLKRPLKGHLIDASDVSSAFNSMDVGSFGGQELVLELYRDSVTGSDTAWTTLPRNTSGYIVVAPYGATPATNDRLEVWPIKVASREPVDIADNEMQRCTVSCAVTSTPNLDAAVA